MNDAIKSISLDDVLAASTEQTSTQANEGLIYNPAHQSSDVNFEVSQGPRNLESAFGNQPAGGFKTTFSQIFDGTSQASRSLMAFALVLIVLLTAGGFYFSDSVVKLLGQLMVEVGLENPFPEPLQPSDQTVDGFGTGAAGKVASNKRADGAQPGNTEGKAQGPAPARQPTAEELSNPYWSLPNTLEVEVPSGTATLGQLSNWRKGLAHPYVFQRLLAVQSARKTHALGSEEIFQIALSQDKFWIRMEALRGLIELGEAVDADTMLAGFHGVRSDLVKNYLQRLRDSFDSADLYFLKQAIRVVDAKSRRFILEQLAQHSSPENILYFIAASYDPNPAVQSIGLAYLKKHPASDADQNNFRMALTAPAPNENVEAVSKKTAIKVPVESTKDLEVEKISPDIESEDVVFFDNSESTSQPVEEKPEVKAEDVQPDDGFEAIGTPEQ